MASKGRSSKGGSAKGRSAKGRSTGKSTRKPTVLRRTERADTNRPPPRKEKG